jgi:acyl-CoA reductase-like NAD-dependent aldehyde dehydrogenase
MRAPAIETTGASIIAGRDVRGGSATFRSIDPRSGREGAVAFVGATPREVADAAAEAARAFEAWRGWAPSARAALLRGIAERLTDRRSAIVPIADEETALGSERLNGELDRTTGQLRAFADLLDEGSYVHAIISPGDARQAPPRPDVRRMLVPIGPVAVFTPSNFPLAFGVAGGDTASALAAGCPVVVKGHPSHPATSEICARAIAAAAVSAGAPAGVFSLLQAREVGVARALVTAPEIQAVGFTGSLAAGRTLHDLAAARPQPIPVYAEMGSLNPVFVAPGAAAARGAAIADGLAAAITQGTGQFCTKPGLVFVVDDEHGMRVARALADAVAARTPGTMLNRALHDTLDRQASRTMALPGVEQLTPQVAAASAPAATIVATIVATSAATFLQTPALQDEHFGPFAIVVRCATPDEMIAAARRLGGNLTATIHADKVDERWAGELAAVLVEKAGRIVWNGYPTGVAVVGAMHHGGPYPASTAAAHTSVGATAIARFLRPVAFQNVPDVLLPEALRDANPLGIQRLLDREWTRDRVRR